MKKLFLLLLTIVMAAVGAFAQGRTVTGVVISGDDLEPVVGAPVFVVGTKLGANTDVEGRFVIKNVPETAKFLRVSYVGMNSAEVEITPGTITIMLSLNTQLLDEVVVTAMGISRSEKSLGYSATQVSGAEIEQAQTNNAMQALQGKVAGLQIQETGSAPGAAPNVNIRGLGSINGSNQPLYVVDGVPLQTSSVGTQGSAIATSGVTNINPDNGKEMYVSDIGNFWLFTVKVPCDVNARTFGSSTPAPNEAYDEHGNLYDIDVTVDKGKIIEKGTMSPSGRPVDSIEFHVSFSDDENFPSGYRYYVHGYRRTGLNGGAE